MTTLHQFVLVFSGNFTEDGTEEDKNRMRAAILGAAENAIMSVPGVQLNQAKFEIDPQPRRESANVG